jgi:hypothetical protein
MSDRELLQKAARAAGEEFGLEDTDRWIGVDWNPLMDDADAFRLAVRLQINILMTYCGPDAIGRPNGTCADAGGPNPPKEPWGSDPLAATRRAIVRAAAAMGDGNNG